MQKSSLLLFIPTTPLTTPLPILSLFPSPFPTSSAAAIPAPSPACRAACSSWTAATTNTSGCWMTFPPQISDFSHKPLTKFPAAPPSPSNSPYRPPTLLLTRFSPPGPPTACSMTGPIWAMVRTRLWWRMDDIWLICPAHPMSTLPSSPPPSRLTIFRFSMTPPTKPTGTAFTPQMV